MISYSLIRCSCGAHQLLVPSQANAPDLRTTLLDGADLHTLVRCMRLIPPKVQIFLAMIEEPA